MFLEKILETKREEVAVSQREETLSMLKEKKLFSLPTRNFKKALEHKPISLLAEIKRASPSKGVLCKNFDPLLIAEGYQTNGASALSVLTDKPFFQGDLNYLQVIKDKIALPLLRKDFILTEYQVYQSKAYGADAILLIAAALESAELKHLLALAKELGMECLVEVHNAEELQTVLSTSAGIIGINNRNLHTFATDLQTTFTLLGQIPSNKIVVSESGINTRKQVKQLAEQGVKAILVGEALVTSDNLAGKIQELIGW